jgi:hypothetical protein
MESQSLKAYRITADYGNFLAFHLPMKDVIQKLGKSFPPKKLMHFYKYNLSLIEAWSDLSGQFSPIESSDNNLPIPDVSLWSSGSLLFSDHAKNTVEKHIGSMGEFLPVQSENGLVWIFNCLTVVNADEERSSREEIDGQAISVSQISFHEEDVTKNLIFKSAFDGCTTVYCNEDFHRLIIQMNLKGINFNENLAGIF